MDFRLLGSSFHCLMAIKEKPLGDRERSRERWKLWLLPRVLWVWTTERDLKFGSRYLGAKLCRIRKRWDILKNRTRSGMFNHDKFRRFLLSTCPRKSIPWINRTTVGEQEHMKTLERKSGDKEIRSRTSHRIISPWTQNHFLPWPHLWQSVWRHPCRKCHILDGVSKSN